MNDQTLIAQALKGDDAAYGQLIEQYQRGLVRYCFTITRDADSAEDVAQEAFIKAYSQLGKYKKEFGFSTWLYKIAHNIALNSIRKVAPLPLNDDYEIAYEDQTPGVMEREEREAKVRASLDALPVNYRTAIHLHYWDHLSYEEIGEVMQVPSTTIKTWLFRARQQIKEECHGIIG